MTYLLTEEQREILSEMINFKVGNRLVEWTDDEGDEHVMFAVRVQRYVIWKSQHNVQLIFDEEDTGGGSEYISTETYHYKSFFRNDPDEDNVFERNTDEFEINY